ncbi:hypothetical protein A8708_22095 [Paenibacillus oryzisoli]|uniref:Helix-turn-helix domain-containing protein n=2 Tax=Paenibacillus oryzisoli TaxID=1850517 RepID=A0A198A8R1_9BACL|nr:hypothetical protein A8708_22095 [Paenibacillus oryzisoli]
MLDELPEMLTVQQTADLLGVCRNTVYTLCKRAQGEGGLPSFKSGNTRRIRKMALLGWIESREKAQTS